MAHSSSNSPSHLQIELKKVKTEKELHKHILHGKYPGATVDLEKRRNEHERSLKLSGKRVMYYWKTRNMKRAENKILDRKKFRLNSHKTSNAVAKPGFVYIIV